MSGETTGCPVAIPNVIFVFGPSSLHVYSRAHIISCICAWAQNVINHTLGVTVNPFYNKMFNPIISGIWTPPNLLFAGPQTGARCRLGGHRRGNNPLHWQPSFPHWFTRGYYLPKILLSLKASNKGPSSLLGNTFDFLHFHSIVAFSYHGAHLVVLDPTWSTSQIS